ncbi:GNAT family N-acetyltransferase [Streptomyces sp. Ac-502]|uniref:GNAT family N-acetyltransferase n=1 Tax=Streptomyces sp. Ac-502 TaxID=3342801 RepID=UPI003862BC18
MTSPGEIPHQNATTGTTAGAAPGTTTLAAAAGTPAGEFTVRPATLEEWRDVARWAADEGWNPGHRDTDCFHATDPDGFFIGLLDGQLVSSVSVVNYSAEYAFLGYYLVHPDHRGTGLGLATWQAAVPHAGNRTIGLDAVPAQEATYRRSGFTTAYRTTRYRGRPVRPGTPAAPVVPVTPEHFDALAAYDQQCFPADRRAFLSRWLTTEGHHAYARLRDGKIAGYGVLRPARDGYRLGPLFADTSQGAEALFDALTSHVGPDDTVHVDIPDPHHGAGSLALSRGLAPDSHTMRMYTGPVAPVRAEQCYAVTSLELG